ncbi:hypothetical protein J6590_037212, partial [Homalodisca vitripennis]
MNLPDSLPRRRMGGQLCFSLCSQSGQGTALSLEQGFSSRWSLPPEGSRKATSGVSEGS